MKEICTDDLIEDYICMCVSLFSMYHQSTTTAIFMVKNRKDKHITKQQHFYTSKMYKVKIQFLFD